MTWLLARDFIHDLDALKTLVITPVPSPECRRWVFIDVFIVKEIKGNGNQKKGSIQQQIQKQKTNINKLKILDMINKRVHVPDKHAVSTTPFPTCYGFSILGVGKIGKAMFVTFA